MSDKIRPQHLSRKAILYIRQSSAYQVTHSLESQKLQYAMQERPRQLLWREIEVVDKDLGRSAVGIVTRLAFERMASEVCLGNVGTVAAREVSRFARNSQEWQQLVEVCRVVDTVLIDQETVHSPRQSNDQARVEKARRGELVPAAPVGYF
jgi:DNA invertase Pin-like site-specific DNA recombinase